MANTTERRKRSLLLCSAILLSVLLVVFSAGCSTSTENFYEFLQNRDYEKAYNAYSKSPSEYSDTFTSFLNTTISDYNTLSVSQDNTYQIINELITAGFSGDEINQCISTVQSLQVSKDSFILAESLYSEYDISNAKNIYLKVIDSDTNYSNAQAKIAEIDKLLEDSNNDYSNAYDLYMNNDLKGALSAYQAIAETGINIEDAQDKVLLIESILLSWDTEYGQNAKTTYPYEAPAKDNFMYMPYSQDNIHAIVKYNITNGETEFLAIAKLPGAFIIKDINLVGEYLYFIAGENVGSGRMINDPYNIYRMKNDGTNLMCIKKGDYKNLITYADGFYVSSYSNGIEKLDRDLNLVEQISEESAIQMQMVNNTLHYSIDTHDKYNLVYAQYSYDGNESIEIRRKKHLRFIIYPHIDIYAYRVGKDYSERIFMYNPANKDVFMLQQDDFIGIYGLVDNQLVCAKEKRSGRLDYHLLNPIDKSILNYRNYLPADMIRLTNICYANNTLIFSTDSGFLVTDSKYNTINKLDFSQYNFEDIALNNDLDFLHTGEYFTQDEIVIVEEGFWYYSNAENNIRIEQQYNEDFDTNVYIAHIRTTNPEYIMVDAPYDDTYTNKQRKYADMMARQYDAVFACNSDFFDENFWTGISIKDGIVYRDRIIEDMSAVYPDGSIVCYTAEDNITAEDLLAAGVKDTFSFGPILLSNGHYGTNLLGHRLAVANPRTAIGMIEPGHYVVILCDGRQPKSSGLTFRSLANIFEDEGCTSAYALDGGQSSAMIFMGEYVNTHMNDNNGQYFRPLSEIIYFGTSDLVPDEEPIK